MDTRFSTSWRLKPPPLVASRVKEPSAEPLLATTSAPAPPPLGAGVASGHFRVRRSGSDVLFGLRGSALSKAVNVDLTGPLPPCERWKSFLVGDRVDLFRATTPST
jgi:hypothetical protein